MNPFALHRKAFAHRSAGDRREAEACFAGALNGFDGLMTTPNLQLAVESRAALIASQGAMLKRSPTIISPSCLGG